MLGKVNLLLFLLLFAALPPSLEVWKKLTCLSTAPSNPFHPDCRANCFFLLLKILGLVFHPRFSDLPVFFRPCRVFQTFLYFSDLPVFFRHSRIFQTLPRFSDLPVFFRPSRVLPRGGKSVRGGERRAGEDQLPGHCKPIQPYIQVCEIQFNSLFHLAQGHTN